MKADKTQVIIVGGGITGLTAALYLAQQGLDFILIEKHPGTSIHPRARTIDIRTMELFRGLGLNDILREGGKALAPAWGIIRGNNLIDTLSIPRPATVLLPGQLEAVKALSHQSPETVCRCTQDISEAIIYKRAQEEGMDIRFHHQMLHFQQDENRVEVLVKNRTTEEVYTIYADYMIAADGANSTVRKYLDIPVTGTGPGVDLLNIYFEADLTSYVKGKEFSQFIIQTPELTGFLLAINNSDRWAFHLRSQTLRTETELIPVLRKVIGIEELKIKILNILPWQLTVRIASYLRVNKIFIAGDAAHTMTPYAGKGANAGIQDVHNLAWKLAAVLKYNASDRLLETYNTERQPVGAFYANLSGEMADKNGLIDDTLFQKNGVKLMGLPDYGYQSAAIIRDTDQPFTFFSGEPGTRLPHEWLDETHSTLDWISGKFVLVINGQQEQWQAACEKIDMPIHIVTHHWKENLLVRPDDFIAAKLTAPEELAGVIQRLLY